jgi:PGF-CTERM protein
MGDTDSPTTGEQTVRRRRVLEALGATGAVAGLTFAASGDVVPTLGDDAAPQVSVPTEVAMLTPERIAPADAFGNAVVLDGDRALVAAPGDDPEDSEGGSQFTNAGAAYVFSRVDGTWTEEARLTTSDDPENVTLGTALALSNDTAVVGAASADIDGESGAGAAYVFQRSGGTWSETQRLTGDVEVLDNFGSPLSISGETLAVGAAGDDTPESDRNGAGSVHVFTRSEDTWSEQTKLVADDPTPGDSFGLGLSLAEDTLLVGAPATDRFGTGTVYAFERSGGSWSQTASFMANEGDVVDGFGATIEFDGNTAAISAPSYNEGDATVGAVYIYDRLDADEWAQRAQLLADDGSNNDRFGIGMGYDDNEVVVGADLHSDDGGDLSGKAYHFGEVLDPTGANEWQQFASFSHDHQFDENDNFGRSVAFAGETALVGAPGREEPGPEDGQGAGAVYVYDLAPEDDDPSTDRETATPGVTPTEEGTTGATPTSETPLPGETDAGDAGDGDDRAETTGESGPGFGVVAAVAGLTGGLLYRLRGDEE